MSNDLNQNQDEFKDDDIKDDALVDDDFDDDDDFDEDDYDDDDFELGGFGNLMRKHLGDNVKQFLADYYGEAIMATLEADTYLDIEKIIKDAFYYGGLNIPDLLYNHRIIKDDDAFDAALEAYVYTPKSFDWPKRSDEWFERDFSDDDEDDDDGFEAYLKESDPMDLTEEELKVRDVIAAADNLINGHAAFANFTKLGYQKLSVETYAYLDERIAFDLDNLTPKGFEKLEETIYWLITEMLNELFGAVNYDLKNRE